MGFHEALENFVKDYGAPDSMIYNGAQEKVGPGTKFQDNLRKIRHPWVCIRKGKFQPKPIRRIYSGTVQEMVSRNV